MVYLVESNGQKPSMCMQDQQGGLPQTPGAPNLQASPGSMIALLYQENGHVTLPQNQPGKPSNRGTVYIYGTSQPKPNETFHEIHNVWNADGTGGDKRGQLLSTQNFDDGQCYQMNNGDISKARSSKFQIQKPTDPEGGDLWCQNNVMLPKNTEAGKPYALYWVWDWPTAPGAPGLPQGKNETYTTCMDVQVTGGSSSSKAAAKPIKYSQTSNYQGAALPAAVKELAQGSNIFVQDPAAGKGSSVASAGAASSAVSQASGSMTALSKHANVVAQPATPAPASQAQASQAPAAATSLVIDPVPTGSVPVTTASAASTPSPTAAAASGAPVSVSVSVKTVTVMATNAVATGTAAAAAANTAAVLSEAPVSGSSGPMAPAATAPAGTSPTPTVQAAAAATQSSEPAPAKKCTAPGAQKRSNVFAGPDSSDNPKAKRSEEFVEEPLEEALNVREVPRAHRRSAKFLKNYLVKSHVQ